jgi:phage tail-like protein
VDAAVILRLLPEVMRESARDDGVLDALVGAMDDLHEPGEQVLRDLDRWFRPLTTPAAAVPALASWVDLEWLLTGEERAGRAAFRPGVDALRALIDDVRELSAWRGTARGLTRFLQIATGVPGFQVRASSERPFHVEVQVPPAATPFLGLVERIVAEESPVCATHEIIVGAVADPSESSEEISSDE